MRCYMDWLRMSFVMLQEEEEFREVVRMGFQAVDGRALVETVRAISYDDCVDVSDG